MEMEYLEGLIIAASVLGMFVVGLLGYVGYRVGWDLEKFKTHWKTTGKGAGAGIVVAVLMFLAFSAITYNVNAAEVKYFNGTTIFAGIDRTIKISPQCVSNNIDARLTSNIGIRQNFVTYKDIDVTGQYTHHSCAVGVDKDVYDGFGVTLQWTFGRK